ncbi:DNA-binding protein WhiA [Williamsoniiplasma luminosum]|uniref:Probable cell division protein WhiA n=1 Tax=Williamsoniiplasma luminosum TaxID=214888 RepID=A0A2S0NKE0_9MOLU|nr:DNA-binding protein WhiA [Williamsoniiplasma luminosum]AVP49474.1 MAG: DNA-binding protein WhiA [Williamsoniiplasma luminosum]
MSFALKVKEEIVSHSFTHIQKQTFLCGFIKSNGEFIYTSTGIKLRLSTISNRIARSLLSMCKEFFKGEIQIAIIQSQSLKKQKTFHLTLIGETEAFLRDLEIYDFNNHKNITVNETVLKTDDLLRAYIAGMFVALGSVNSPETINYHLEVQFKDLESAEYFSQILNKKYDFDFKILVRSENKIICYIKKSALVSDFIKLVDAPISVMEFENERISRDLVNNINRIQNIDIYNQRKTTSTAEKQTKQIHWLKEQKMFNALSDRIKILANLRLANPEMSYLELAQAMNKKGHKITKSGISNIFRTIDKIVGVDHEK